MKNNLFNILGMMAFIALGLTSCKKDLNRTPTNQITANQAFSTPAGYKEGLAKIYGAFALTSSTGPGVSDLGGVDAGTSDFLRLYWNAQEFPTDEAAWVFNDAGVPDFHNMNWSSNNVILLGLYTRCIYQITVANAFINQASDANLSSRGITGTDATNVRFYKAEARFLRAYQYSVLMDLFANPPFVDENSPIGSTSPKQISRADLFAYIESELKAIDGLLVKPRQNEYGRADEAADWALQARIFLNAEVYLGTGKGRYTDAMTYADKVISAGYTLLPKYANLFLADNNLNNTEVILSINYDGVNTQNYGGTTFIINGAVSGAMNPAAFGIPNGGWGANRCTQSLPLLFPDHSGNTDKRAMFYGNELNMDTLQSFTSGLKVIKFKNITSTGATPMSSNGSFCSTDFPLFRLGEMYLTYAEAALRSGTGTSAALQYFNTIRERAYGNASGDVTSIALQDILNERGREMYWEATRRTDLIRFGQFTGSNYLWAFKGGVKAGRAVESFRTIYPIPANDITANTNLKQNPGY